MGKKRAKTGESSAPAGPGANEAIAGVDPRTASAVRKIDALLASKGGTLHPSLPSFSGVKEVRALWDAPREEQARAAELLIARLYGREGAGFAADVPSDPEARRTRELLERALAGLLTKPPPLSEDALLTIVEFHARVDPPLRDESLHSRLQGVIEAFARNGKLSPPLAEAARRFSAAIHHQLADPSLRARVEYPKHWEHWVEMLDRNVARGAERYLKRSGEAIETPRLRNQTERMLDALAARLAGEPDLAQVRFDELDEARAIFDAEPGQKAAAVETILARLERIGAPTRKRGDGTGGREKQVYESALSGVLRGAPVSSDVLARLASLYAAVGPPLHRLSPLEPLTAEILERANGRTLPERLRGAAMQFIDMLRRHMRDEGKRAALPDAERWEHWIGDLQEAGKLGIYRHLEPGEAWSDAALADINALDPPARGAWIALIVHCKSLPDTGRPGAGWLDRAREAVDAIGFDAFRNRLVRWFPLLDRPRTRPQGKRQRWQPDLTNSIEPAHVQVLRGLVWSCEGRPDRDLTRALARLAASAYRKIPKIGPRLVSLGNACVMVLGTVPGVEAVGQLAMLKTRVKFGTAQRQVESAFDDAAKREALPRDEIEELAVPSYGMDEVGVRREEFGDVLAEMVANADGVAIRWTRAGAALKSAPAAVRKAHPEAWKELQGAARDAEAMLTTVRERLDAVFLARKSWPLDAWRQRYLDHPLAGVVARRLIWTFADGGTSREGGFDGGRIVDRDGREIAGFSEGTTVTLWHPLARAPSDVLAWRAWLEDRRITQPFKQAHREVYLLTVAERRTGTYSNRFAAHVLKQHPFHALCGVRGWKDRLRLMVDDSYPPPSRPLPAWGLRAEFWVEGAGDDYDRDTNESGAFLYLATDQVRFYPIDAAQRRVHASGGGYRSGQEDRPLALDEVPPLVFSEVLRDIDLFVGVTSVGNDPTWSDGGPGGRHADYWQRYSFGDLSATAQTRKAVLQQLVPRLKIADRVSFADRFLVVRGDLRTYRIHLGSGNILMEPNDQYLCIVPKGSAAVEAGGQVFLPFEGDGMLSIILSKALLLADDRKIKDETIARQIRT